MFIVYGSYRFMHLTAFHLAALGMDTQAGLINTIILLTSGMTAAMSVTAFQKKNIRFSRFLISLTILFALAFLLNKFFEFSGKIQNGIYPGSSDLMSKPEGEIIYFGLFYVLSGLHILHLLAGIIFLILAFKMVRTNADAEALQITKLKNITLFWNVVCLIWLFLYPLFYLIH